MYSVPEVPLKRDGWSGYVFSKYLAISQLSLTHFPPWFSSMMTGTCTCLTVLLMLHGSVSFHCYDTQDATFGCDDSIHTGAKMQCICEVHVLKLYIMWQLGRTRP